MSSSMTVNRSADIAGGYKVSAVTSTRHVITTWMLKAAGETLLAIVPRVRQARLGMNLFCLSIGSANERRAPKRQTGLLRSSLA